MRNLVLSLAVVLTALAIPAVARADDEQPSSSSSSSTTAAASPTPPAAPKSELHVERNSVAMMITGIGLGTLGIVALGVGTGLIIQGHRNCDGDAVGKTANLPLVEGAAVYQVANDICVSDSPMINGGLASIVAGSAFTAAGIAFTVAGAWKITVPGRSASSTHLRVGLGSMGVGGTF